jgi:hypothetical protein
MAYTTIDKSEDYFNTITWTGDGSRPVSITGVGFQPDMVWAKNRSPDAFEHKLYDSSRGAGSDKELTPNEPYYEGESNADTYGYLSSFDSDGFSSTDSNYNAYFNKSGTTYVAWNWKANAGSTSSNTDGSITSTVQTNVTAGFSIATYTGNGIDNRTIGHGLGVQPSWWIVKRKDSTGDWWFGASSILGGTSNYLKLNSTAANAEINNIWGDSPTSSTLFRVSNNAGLNASGGTYVAYLFANKQGYSKFGKYTGNGNANGTFVYTGFKPAFIMIKRIDSISNWTIWDSKRDPFNYGERTLFPNLNNAEESGNVNEQWDLLSNGFKFRSDGRNTASGGTYIYIAFAENPFVTSTGIPTTAR